MMAIRDDTLPLYAEDLIPILLRKFARRTAVPGVTSTDHLWFNEGCQAVLSTIQDMKRRADEDKL